MFGKNKKFILSGFLTVVFVFGLFQITLAAVPTEITAGLKITADEAKISTGGNIMNLIGNIIGGVLSFIGVIFFALMVFGGFMWMTARGKEEQTKKATGTVTAAVIGLVIVLSSYAITNVVFQNTYLKPTPPPSEEANKIDPKDVACDTAHKGWRCGDIDKCQQSGEGIRTVAPESLNKVETVKNVCTESGKNNCLYSTSNEADAKPLCETPEGGNVQVCCQPQDESQKKYDWCFVVETGKCEKLDSYGPGNCTDESKTKVLKDVTEKECYVGNLKGLECKEDSYCQTPITGFKCNALVEGTSKICSEDSQGTTSGEGGGQCVSTKDCKTGVCKDGVCTLLDKNCTLNTPLAGLMCGAMACDQKDADVLCTANTQCASKHCVNGKCELGKDGASCESSSDCETGYFCTSRGTPSCCLKKLNRGEKCYGNNEACLSKVCIDKIGLEDVCQ